MPRVRSKAKVSLLPSTDEQTPVSTSYTPAVRLQDAPGQTELAETHLDSVYPHLVRWKAKMLLPSDPQNPDEFCLRHRITRAELESLTLRPTYGDDVLAASIEWSKSRAPEMLHSMYTDGKTSAAGAEKFIKSLVEVIRRRTDATSQTQINVFGGMDDDKFERIVTRALRGSTEPLEGSPHDGPTV